LEVPLIVFYRAMISALLMLIAMVYSPATTFAAPNDGWSAMPRSCSDADAAQEQAKAEADASDDMTAFHDFQRAVEQYELCANRLDVQTAFVAHYIAEAKQAGALTRIAAYQESYTGLGNGPFTAQSAGLQFSTICTALQSASPSQVKAVNHGATPDLYLMIGALYLGTVGKDSPLEAGLRACMTMINAAYKAR
jgi:hypothetical protein